MAEKEGTRVLIEPSNQVVDTLRFAVADVGPRTLLQRHNYSFDLLEKWTNGQEWVPLDIVKEACEINRRNPEAPSFSKVLLECTSGAQFRISKDEEGEKAGLPSPKDVTLPENRTKMEPGDGPLFHTTRPHKPNARRQMTKIAIVLFIFPLLGAAFGVIVLGDPKGAIIGTLVSYAIAIALVFVILLPRALRGPS